MFGPRLDRPSVIGDEGRSRATSLWLATLVVLGLGTAAGAVLGDAGLVVSLGSNVGAVVAGAALMNRERFVHLLVGHVVFFLFGSLLVLWLLVVTLRHPFGLAVLGVAVAMVGVGVSWANLGTTEALRNTLFGTLGTYAVVLVSVALLVAVALGLALGDVVLEVTTAGVTPGVSLAWFLLAAGFAAAGIRVLFWQLPVAQLSAVEKRAARTARLRVAGRVATATALLSPVAAGLALLGVVGGAFDALGAVAPPVVAVLDALGSPWLLGAVVLAGTAALAVAAVAGLLRAATRRFDPTTARLLAAVGAGLVMTLLIVTTVLTAALVPAYSTLMTALFVLLAVNVGPLTLIAANAVGIPGVALGLFPDRAGGPAVAATGLLVATVALGAGRPWLVFAFAAGTVVVWDLSTYGLGLTAELGHIPETRRLELVHGLVVVGIGAVAVALLVGVDSLRIALAGAGGTTATFVAGIGVLLLLLPLRG